MTNLNKVTLIGRIGRDPEARYTQAGKAIVTFSVATDSGYKDKNTGQWVAKAQWHNIVVMNDGLAKIIVASARKGSLAYIEGELQYETYTDKSGVEKNATKIMIGMFNGAIKMLDAKPSGGQSIQEQVAANVKANGGMPNDDIPF